MVLQPDYAHSAMNASNETQAHTLTATDNLILVLLAVRAFLGGAGILRRKNKILNHESHALTPLFTLTFAFFKTRPN